MYNFGVCNLESHINSSQVGPVLAKYSMQFKAEGFLFFFLRGGWVGLRSQVLCAHIFIFSNLMRGFIPDTPNPLQQYPVNSYLPS